MQRKPMPMRDVQSETTGVRLVTSAGLFIAAIMLGALIALALNLIGDLLL